MFKSSREGNVVYKCSIRLLDDSFLELEFQVDTFQCYAFRRKIVEISFADFLKVLVNRRNL